LSEATLEKLQPHAAVTHCSAGQVIAQTAPERWHCVLGGAVRLCALHPDGRRQIVDLLLPGDWFAIRDINCLTAEAAIEGTLLASYSRRRIEALGNTNLDVARAIGDGAFAAISRLQRQLLVLGHITAPEKVGAFLLEISERLAADSVDRILLPISRYDIADYLAMSVETVSRALTDLRHRGIIVLTGAREVKIMDRGALEERLLSHPAAHGHHVGISPRLE
jgi:CRP/FNR family nitrogen fixation transcriptional regulator